MQGQEPIAENNSPIKPEEKPLTIAEGERKLADLKNRIEQYRLKHNIPGIDPKDSKLALED
jgi:hypothetical protein